MGPFGDHVMCSKLPFDSWRHRYDDCIVALVERANYSGVEEKAEVFGFFRDLIPARAMGEVGKLEMVRQRQGCVPDRALRLPTIQGQTTRHLSKQKFISSGSSRYPRGCGDKAVDRRARALPEEYRARFSTIDRQYHGVIRGQIGPLKERFDSMGELQCLVVGRFGEGSQHL